MRRALLLACLAPLLAAGCDAGTGVGTAMTSSSAPKIQDHWDGPEAALARAAEHGDAAGVAEAVRAGADPDALSQHGMPMVLWPVLSNSYEGFVALLDAGADPEARFPASPEDTERTAIATEFMVRAADDRFLAEAFARGADPDAVGSNQEPLIWKAHYADLWDRVRMIVEAGGDVDAPNHGEAGATLLRNYSAGAFDRAVWLLERGARATYKLDAAPPGHEDRLGAMPILENIYYYEIDAERFPELAAAQRRAQEIVRERGDPVPPRPRRYAQR